MCYLEDVLQLSQHRVHLSVQQPAELLLLRTAHRQTHPVPAAHLRSPPARLTSTALSAELAAIAVAIIVAGAVSVVWSLVRRARPVFSSCDRLANRTQAPPSGWLGFKRLETAPSLGW